MSVKLNLLQQSGRLKPYEKLIRDAFEEVLPKIESKINIPAVDVVVADNPDAAIPEIGVGGYASNEHLVYISINPDFQNLEKTLKEEIKSTLAHELHHCARMKAVGYGETLREAAISEGLADHFALEINGGNPKPWSVAIQDEELKNIYKISEKYFNNRKYNHSAWFFGSPDSDIPRWAGYSIGFDLAKKFMEKSGKTASELVALEASKFV